MDILINIAIAVISLIVGGAVAMVISKKMAHSRANNIIEEAKLEADVLKKNKILEAKEEEMKMKAEAEKVANARLSKIQSAEAKAKQRELQLNQMQSEVQKKKNENDALQKSLDLSLIHI